ncbi:MAG: DNA-binding protein [Hydrogenophaga sp.]|uniref:helix-turn-helix transcriptional regulator n=1 Tax=Hydrogenophaga sp. TaxID=1904254 RepID=UPI00169E2115|nr:DNA-binding protein [Hydrogenophaga sp.]NIM41180.1 DNA-binding protein [Hydrogenophaga sp.]NIN26496.1 DNA-binding protein [Hydrogenophaga sp.]NIN31371.1 DNA-binding protein [Hydrogenophaga sp.]NIN55426.1 DNA-binding protein [Hydrogenophaga sp.]NIO51761.1 DNA-binding protein [Hydrogenophaga sp.]
MEYTFTLKYQIAEQGADLDELIERLGAAGCDDALVGMGQPGRLALEFAREADSATAALTSALADVKRACPEAKLIEAAPDLVGLSDVATMMGVTRQNMRKLMLGHAASFPTPVHEGSASVWHLAEVMAWLQTRGAYEVDAPMLEVALTAMQVNLAKEVEVRQLRPEICRELRSLFA